MYTYRPHFNYMHKKSCSGMVSTELVQLPPVKMLRRWLYLKLIIPCQIVWGFITRDC